MFALYYVVSIMPPFALGIGAKAILQKLKSLVSMSICIFSRPWLVEDTKPKLPVTCSMKGHESPLAIIVSWFGCAVVALPHRL
jgi:hypothetical protein